MTRNVQILMGEYHSCIESVSDGHLKKIILYGSYARGDYTAGSDYSSSWSNALIFETLIPQVESIKLSSHYNSGIHIKNQFPSIPHPFPGRCNMKSAFQIRILRIGNRGSDRIMNLAEICILHNDFKSADLILRHIKFCNNLCVFSAAAAVAPAYHDCVFANYF